MKMNRSMMLGGAACALTLAAWTAAQALYPLIAMQGAAVSSAVASRAAPPTILVPLSFVSTEALLAAQVQHVPGQVVLDLHALDSIDAAEDLALAEVQRWEPGGPPVCWLRAESAEQQAAALAALTRGACAEVRIAG